MFVDWARLAADLAPPEPSIKGPGERDQPADLMDEAGRRHPRHEHEERDRHDRSRPARSPGRPGVSARTFLAERTNQFKNVWSPRTNPTRQMRRGGDAVHVDVHLRDDAVEIEGPAQRQRDHQVGRERQAQAAQQKEDQRDEARVQRSHSHGRGPLPVVSCVSVMVLIVLMGSFFSVPSVSRLQRSRPKMPGS